MSKRKLKRFKDTYLIPILLILLSFIVVSLYKGNFFSFLILTFGLLNGWYAGLGKWYNYVFGAGFSLMNAYVSFEAHLYGIAFFSAILYFPIQIHGLIDWHKKKNKNDEVRVRSFNIKNSIVITLSCIFGSIAFGSVLTKIPGQNLAFMDSTSNVINICGMILMNLRFRECWWVLLGNNIIDLLIWCINLYNGISNSLMMVLVSLSYLILNIICIVKWEKIKNKIRY